MVKQPNSRLKSATIVAAPYRVFPDATARGRTPPGR